MSGLIIWGIFLNWGDIPFDFHDWAEVWAPRIAVVRDALLKNTLPFHMSDTTALRGVTDRFFTIPDIISTPQMILLRFLETGPYILVNILILYTIACWGLLLLRRRFSLSLAVFSALFILYHFNGNIISHISVGHINWGGYYLFPFFLLLTLHLLDGDHSWRWVSKMAFLLFFINLQGSFHHFIWCAMFLGILALTCWRTFFASLKTLVAAVLLNLFRLLPPILGLGKFDNEFIGGYPSLLDLLKAMLVIKPPAESLTVRSAINLLGWWELDIYIGLAGVLLVIFFGIFRWLKTVSQGKGHPELVIPVLTLVLLSIGRVYRLVMMLSIPLLNAQRVSSRIFLLPFTFLLVFGAWELQQWINSASPSPITRAAGLGILAVMGHDLWQHLKLWQVTNASLAFPFTPRDLTLVMVNNRPDPPYFTLLGVGAALSLLTIIFLLIKSFTEQKEVKP